MSVEEQQESISIEYLNDDCLLHIMKFIDLAQLWHLQDFNQRWRELVSVTFRKLDFTAARCRDLTFTTISEMIDLLGHRVKSMTIDFPDYEFFVPLFELIARKCDRLVNLDIDNLVIDSKLVKVLPSFFHRLRQLQLGSNIYYENDFIDCFRFADVLESISVSYNYDVGFLLNVKSLEHLKFGGEICSPDKTVRILENNKNLKSIEIYAWTPLDDRIPETMISQLKQLHTLTITIDVQSKVNFELLGDITSLKKMNVTFNTSGLDDCDMMIVWHSGALIDGLLKRLTIKNQLEYLFIRCNGAIIKDSTIQLISKLSNLSFLGFFPWRLGHAMAVNLKIDKLQTLQNLESFTITTNNNIIMPNACMELIKACSNLSYLDVSGNTLFNMNFVVQLIEFLKNDRRSKRFELTANRTMIPWTATADRFVVENGRFLKLNVQNLM